jgi:phosphohistidine phosphatase
LKTLLLLRHGKAARQAADGIDHSRPLAPRGQQASRLVGRFLTASQQIPDLVLASTAVRAVETAQLAAEAGGWRAPHKTSRDLYLAASDTLLARIQELSDDFATVLLVGHEPTWSTAVSRLTGGSRVRFPPGTLARVDLPTPRWRDVAFDRADLVFLLPPSLMAAPSED